MTDTFQAPGAPLFQRSKTALLGPADADHYRVKIGRYGDRFYCDPLPADDTFDAWKGVAPSISIVKKASGSDWTFVALKRVAQSNPEISGLEYEMRYEMLKSINKTGLNAAARRGTNIHLYCESKLHGNPVPIPDGAPGHEYMPSVDAWFDQHQPELVAAEYVVIDRDLHGSGYGGTPDGLIKVGGDLFAIDWKSRGQDSDHAAYPEEAEQIAAGHRAQYMIVEGPDGPERRPIPAVAGGLVISIKPDGCRTYPIDIDHAYLHWEARHAWWCARRTEREPIGRQWATKSVRPVGDSPTTTAGEQTTGRTPEQRISNLRERCQTIAQLCTAAGDPTVLNKLRMNLSMAGLDLKTMDPTEANEYAATLIVEACEADISAPFADLATTA